jgi:hypothetical protein
MIIILRGHIRNSFHNNDLYNLIKNIDDEYGVIIYIHTWNIFASKSTWRNDVEENPTPVSEELIRAYFNELSSKIVHIMIDDDTKIVFHETNYPDTCNLKCNLKMWKNYVYGMYNITEYVKNDIGLENQEYIFNVRFDILQMTRIADYQNMSNQIFELLEMTRNTNEQKNTRIRDNKISFIYESRRFGLDNAYLGKIDTMYQLLWKFEFQLKSIIEKYPTIINQEFLFYEENENTSPNSEL